MPLYRAVYARAGQVCGITFAEATAERAARFVEKVIEPMVKCPVLVLKPLPPSKWGRQAQLNLEGK